MTALTIGIVVALVIIMILALVILTVALVLYSRRRDAIAMQQMADDYRRRHGAH